MELALACALATALLCAWPVVYVVATERLLDAEHRRTVALHSHAYTDA